ncbi:MAG: TetR/AcrR family transcriptional regulator [Desulfuromonadales bacterium]|nr:MAG: TetR/AcrR family transcriptional regulator [Desulfuromonadales bacterium]
MRPEKGEAKVNEAVRERLLTAALELFVAKGYASTSVREIVAAAGVTKPVLYYYFGSKEGIYLELMTGTFATFRELISNLSASPGTARERILHFATGVFDGFVEHIAVVRFMYAMFFGPSQGAPSFPLEQGFEMKLEAVGGMVEEGVRSGEMRAVDVRDITWAIVSCMNTVMEEQLCRTPSRIDREGLVRVLTLILDCTAQGGSR